MNELISVIIPVYNVEQYLKRCVDSVINQTYKNLEIILVDDGSKDNSSALCDEYLNEDDRIRVYHKENGGLSSARNYGIERCHGEYISFIDSDDFVAPCFIEALYTAIKVGDDKLASLSWPRNFFDGTDETAVVLDATIENMVVERVTSKEALLRIMYQKIPNGAQHRLYHRSLFQTIRFPFGYLFEDVATVYKTFELADKIAFIDLKLYAYRIRANSIVRVAFSKKKMVCVPISDELFKHFKNDTELKAAAAARCFAINYQIFLQCPKENYEDLDLLWNEIKKYRAITLFDSSKMMRIKNRIAALISFFGKSMAHTLGNRFGNKVKQH